MSLYPDLSGFASFRTPMSQMPARTVTARRCSKCGCKLNSGNLTDTCCACSFGEVELPDYIVSLVENADSQSIDLAARAITNQTLTCTRSPERRQELDERGARWLALADSGWTEYEIAACAGVPRSTIQTMLKRERRRVKRPPRDLAKERAEREAKNAAVRAAYGPNETYRSVAEKFGLTHGQVGRILRRETAIDKNTRG